MIKLPLAVKKTPMQSTWTCCWYTVSPFLFQGDLIDSQICVAII